MFLAFAALMAGMQTAPEPVTVELYAIGEECRVVVGNTVVAGKTLDARARKWATEGRRVRIQGVGEVSYRCIGRVIYRMQRAGVVHAEFFHDQSPKVELAVPDGPCRVELNGHPMTLDALPAAIDAWGESNPHVRFELNPKAAYDCVDRVFGILKAAKVPMQLGLIGNEALSETPR